MVNDGVLSYVFASYRLNQQLFAKRPCLACHTYMYTYKHVNGTQIAMGTPQVEDICMNCKGNQA